MGKEKKSDRLLTDLELELMTAVWALGECTVKDVVDRLAPTRKLAYTSVATVMKILEEKKFLASRKEDRVITYRALLPRAEYEARTLRHVATRVFQGRPSTMVARLLDDAALSKEELEEIKRVLKERLES